MTLTLSSDAADQIAAQCVGSPDMETGGLLIGTRDGERAFVWAATGPGSHAAAAARTLRLDTSFVLGVITGVSVAGVVEILGRWHKHVAPDLRASDNDRAGAQAFRQFCDTSLDIRSTYELVVGTDRDVPVGYGAYLCTAEGLSRIACSSHLTGGGNGCAADFPSRPGETSSSSKC